MTKTFTFIGGKSAYRTTHLSRLVNVVKERPLKIKVIIIIAYPCRPPKWLWLVDMRICPHLPGETLPGPLWWLVQLWWNWIQEWSVMDLRWFWVVSRIPGLLHCHFQYLLSQGERPADDPLFFSASVKNKQKIDYSIYLLTLI